MGKIVIIPLRFDMLYKTISGLLNISITISKHDSLVSNPLKVNKFINRLSKKISKKEGIGFQKIAYLVVFIYNLYLLVYQFVFKI